MSVEIPLQMRIQNLKTRITIFQALEAIGVLLPRGHNTQQLICPFHEDTKPSARVYSDTQKMFCFKCGRLWDCVQLMMTKRDCDVASACEALEKRFGINPNVVDLVSAIRAQVATTYQPSRDSSEGFSTLYNYVEERLKDARFLMGLPLYCRALYALDLYVYYYKERGLEWPKFKEAMTTLLSFIPKETPGSSASSG